MNSDAIKEIANQLGVGADYLLAHLSEFAPKWAAMKVAENGSACLLAAVALAVSSCVLMKTLREYRDCDDSSDDGMLRFYIMLVFMTIALVGLITLCFELPDTMRYLASPDAAIVGDVLGAMKR